MSKERVNRCRRACQSLWQLLYRCPFRFRLPFPLSTAVSKTSRPYSSRSSVVSAGCPRNMHEAVNPTEARGGGAESQFRKPNNHRMTTTGAGTPNIHMMIPFPMTYLPFLCANVLRSLLSCCHWRSPCRAAQLLSERAGEGGMGGWSKLLGLGEVGQVSHACPPDINVA